MIDVGSAVGYLLLDTSDFVSKLKTAGKDLSGFISDTQTSANKVQAVGSSLSGVGASLTKGVTTPLVGAGAAIVKFAGDADSAFSQFRAKVGEVKGSTEEYQEVMENIYKNNYGESFEDVANAMADVVTRMGELDPSNLQKTAENALALRDSFGYETSESLRAVDTLMKNFGLTSEQAFDYIVKGQQQGLDFSGEFLDTINEYSVQFGKVGMSADDMFAIFKEGADSGAWNLDKIGDAVKEFAVRAVDGSKNTVAGFEALGFNADEMAAKFAAGGDTARQAFDQVITALAEMEDPLAQNTAGVNLFGTMWEDLGPEVVTQLKDVTNSTIDAAGAMDELKEVRYDNLESAIGGLLRQITSFAADLGEYLIPYVEKAIDFISKLAEGFNNLSEPAKQIVITIGLFAAAIGPVLLIAGKLITSITSMVSAVSTIGTAIKGVVGIFSNLGTVVPTILSGISKAVTGLFSLIAANPVAAIIIAIIAAITLLWTQCEWFRDAVKGFVEAVIGFFSNMGEKIKEALQAVGDFFVALGELISSGLSTVAQVILDIFSACIEGIKAAWNGIVEFFTLIWEGIKLVFSAVAEFFAQVFTLAVEAVKLAWGAIVDFFSLIWEGIKAVFSGVVEFFSAIFTAAWEAVKAVWEFAVEFFSAIWEGIKLVFSTVVEFFQSVFSAAWEAIKAIWSAVVDFFSSVWAGIQTVFSAVVEFFATVFGAAWEAIKATWSLAVEFFQGVCDGIQAVFTAVTEFIAELFIKLSDKIQEIWNALVEFFTAICESIRAIFETVTQKIGELWNALVDAIKKAWESVVQFFTEIANKIKDAFSAAIQFIQDLFQKAVDGIKEAWNGVVDFFEDIWESIKGVFGDLSNHFQNIGNEIVNALKDGILGAWDSFTSWVSDKVGSVVDKVTSIFGGGSAKSKGSYATGLDYVPSDGLYTLHEGEAVLTKEQNKRRSTSSGDTYNFYSPKALDPVTAAREMKKAKQQVMLGFV